MHSGSLTESVDLKFAEGVEGDVIHIETGGDARRLDLNWEIIIHEGTSKMVESD